VSLEIQDTGLLRNVSLCPIHRSSEKSREMIQDWKDKTTGKNLDYRHYLIKSSLGHAPCTTAENFIKNSS